MNFINWIVSFFIPTLESALSDVQRTVSKLERVADHAFEQVRQHEIEIQKLSEAADQASTVALRAVRVTERLKELVA